MDMGSVVDDGDDRDSVYVAVGSDVAKGKTTLIWAVRNLVKRKFCLLHVHQPKYSVSSTDAASTTTKSKLLEIEALHKEEIQKVHELLTEYHSFLSRLEVYSEKVWIEMESIEEGIMEGIYRYSIRWLVMGTGLEGILNLENKLPEGTKNFQQEVEVLSRVRHPNLMTLIGTCPESQSLVYEYIKNGSLKEHLACKNNKWPLPWHIRVLIAFDICSALVFLGTQKPPVVHGDSSKVLLDANYVGKISDIGISRLIPDNVNHEMTAVYVDPESGI